MSSSHGGINPWAMKEAGINPDDVMDFSVSINPVSLPPSIKRVFRILPSTAIPTAEAVTL